MKKLYIALSVVFILMLMVLFLVIGSNSLSTDKEDSENKGKNLKETIINTKKIKGKHQLKLETNKEIIRQLIIKRKKEEQQKSEKDKVFNINPDEKE